MDKEPHPFDGYRDKDGKFHGKMENAVGTFYFVHGLYHREDGPARIFKNPLIKEWYLYGVEVSLEVFLIVTQCSDEDLPLYLGLGCDHYIAKRLKEMGSEEE